MDQYLQWHPVPVLHFDRSYAEVGPPVPIEQCCPLTGPVWHEVDALRRTASVRHRALAHRIIARARRHVGGCLYLWLARWRPGPVQLPGDIVELMLEFLLPTDVLCWEPRFLWSPSFTAWHGDDMRPPAILALLLAERTRLHRALALVLPERRVRPRPLLALALAARLPPQAMVFLGRVPLRVWAEGDVL